MIAKNLVKPIGILCIAMTFLSLQGCVTHPTTATAKTPTLTIEQAEANRRYIEKIAETDRNTAYKERLRDADIYTKKREADAKVIRAQNPSHPTYNTINTK